MSLQTSSSLSTLEKTLSLDLSYQNDKDKKDLSFLDVS